jgi:hypothetical protein
MVIVIWAQPASAANATGKFWYGDPDRPSEQYRIENPEIGKCYVTQTHGPAWGAKNETNATASVYKDTNCKEPAGKVDPGQWNRQIRFTSVQFPQ